MDGNPHYPSYDLEGGRPRVGPGTGSEGARLEDRQRAARGPLSDDDVSELSLQDTDNAPFGSLALDSARDLLP